ncbi:MAG: MFS transporter [Pseudomonadota bacterium]
MTLRWRMLACLVIGRMAMAFQFQAVAALAPLYLQTLDIGLATLGLLVGLYMAPGILISLPGGALARRYGDREMVIAGLALMVIGGTIMALFNSLEAQLAGRLIAGCGGVALNVLASKMVADWFADGPVATAMGILITAWPVGLALALGLLPLAAGAGGLTAALGVVIGVAALGLAVMVLGYRDPPRSVQDGGATAAPAGLLPGRAALGPMLAAGSLWGLYNAGLGMVFAFGPAMLATRGLTLEAAGALVAVAFWGVAVAVPLGGALADASRRGTGLMVAGIVGFAALVAMVPVLEPTILLFAILGLLGGLPAGPITSLPARSLAPRDRAQGIAVFFTLFYLAVVLAPPLIGHLADAAGDPALPFIAAAVLEATALLALLAYRLRTRRP